MRLNSCKTSSTSTGSGAAMQPLARLFRSWLALGLLLNLGLGQLQLPIGPLWLWLVVIPALCTLAVPGALKDFVGIRWAKLARLNGASRRVQAKRKPFIEA